jgi:hypothetical protein
MQRLFVLMPEGINNYHTSLNTKTFGASNRPWGNFCHISNCHNFTSSSLTHYLQRIQIKIPRIKLIFLVRSFSTVRCHQHDTFSTVRCHQHDTFKQRSSNSSVMHTCISPCKPTPIISDNVSKNYTICKLSIHFFFTSKFFRTYRRSVGNPSRRDWMNSAVYIILTTTRTNPYANYMFRPSAQFKVTFLV